MANHKSAKKRIRQTAKRNLNNKVKKSRVRTEIKKFAAAVAENNKESATELFKFIQSKLAKMAKTPAMNKKTASRKTSRLANQLAKLS